MNNSRDAEAIKISMICRSDFSRELQKFATKVVPTRAFGCTLRLSGK